MAELPRGTVTFLFTDIEGSTRLLHKLGAERYAAALAEHRHALRTVFAEHGGVEVDTQGDAFFYSFPTAPNALAAAREAQAALAPTDIAVRMGVHTGTAFVTEEGYVGEDVHRAARIAGVGHGGQVLVSTTAAALASGEALRDLGEHRLKDLSAPERIYQLGAADFPPLATLYCTNLPVPATPFLGRRSELVELVRLLARDDVRLITLTGPGGTGKTRLAAQAAGAASHLYPDGVWWVELATIKDPELVIPTAAGALGVAGDLDDHIGEKRLLLVFDNFEQVVEAAAQLGHLLQVCPQLNVVVTSREPLHVAAEQQYAVAPLEHDEAVELFGARARAARPEFQTNGTSSEICRRLEGLPLAIELAAARMKALSPGDILMRLERRLPLLTGGPRDAPERQRTLAATIEWSHDLLDDTEQQLFRRLSVFAGGCRLEAAERVADAELDALQSLVDKSLVRYSDGRYWMLETIREYAADRLAESDEEADVRDRHAAYFIELAKAAGLTLEPRGQQRYALVRPESANLRAALAWLLERDPQRCLQLAAALDAFWVVTDPSEGMRWYALLLDRVSEAPLELQARLFMAYGSAANPAGDDELAERMYRRSLEAFTELGDEVGISVALLRLGISALYRGDTAEAAEYGDQALSLSRKTGYRVVECQALGLMGELEYLRGEHVRGTTLIERSAELAGEVDFPWWRSRMLRKLVDCLLDLDRPAEAEARARESLRLMDALGDQQMMVFALARLARIAAETGRREQAGLLWGAIEAEEARSAMGAWAKERHRLGAPVLAHDGAEFQLGLERGRCLLLAEAIDLALTPARQAEKFGAGAGTGTRLGHHDEEGAEWPS